VLSSSRRSEWRSRATSKSGCSRRLNLRGRSPTILLAARRGRMNRRPPIEEESGVREIETPIPACRFACPRPIRKSCR
jgi:hypothetical protein